MIPKIPTITDRLIAFVDSYFRFAQEMLFSWFGSFVLASIAALILVLKLIKKKIRLEEKVVLILIIIILTGFSMTQLAITLFHQPDHRTVQKITNEFKKEINFSLVKQEFEQIISSLCVGCVQWRIENKKEDLESALLFCGCSSKEFNERKQIEPRINIKVYSTINKLLGRIYLAKIVLPIEDKFIYFGKREYEKEFFYNLYGKKIKCRDHRLDIFCNELIIPSKWNYVGEIEIDLKNY